MKLPTFALIALTTGALTLSACGESKEEKASKEVCNARADISKQVDSLKSLQISGSIKSDLTTAFDAIKGDLQRMKDAQADLTPERKQQVETATQTFTAQLQQIAKDAVDNLSLANAQEQIKAALTALGAAYKQALAPIEC